MEKAAPPVPRFENVLIGFSISATYAAAALKWFYEGRTILFGITFTASLLLFGMTYALAHRRGNLIGRLAITVAILPVVLELVPQVLLIYPIYHFGRYCVAPEVGISLSKFRSVDLAKDACAFLPVVVGGILLAIINPQYLYALWDFPGFNFAEFCVYLFLLGLISMAFLAAARLRGRLFTFAKVSALLFSILFSFVALALLWLAPAAATMSKQMRIIAQEKGQ